MKTLRLALVLAVAALPTPNARAADGVPAVAPNGPVLRLTAADGEVRVLRAADLAMFARRKVAVQDHGRPAEFEGVDLLDVLRLADAPLGEALRGPALATYLLVEAADGYRAVVALAEVDPGIGGRRALLCDRRDGKPLSAHEGPWRLVLPGDRRAARWVRRVSALRVRTAP